MNEQISYEQPLNERIRTFLRLEHLFNKTAYTLRGFSVWDSRATIAGLLDILDILARGELKTEMLKELDRQRTSLSRLMNIPGVDAAQLNSILNQLDTAQSELHAINGQLGQSMRQNELLGSLRQRSSITGGTCNFDLPGYHYWLQQVPEKRIEVLESWFDELNAVAKPISIMLGILRESADPVSEVAEKGFFQQSLDPKTPVQLIRVNLPAESQVFPEISAGKHRFSIRFLEARGTDRPLATEADIPFTLTCCSI